MEGFTLEGDLKFFYEARTAETLGPADIKVDGVDLLRDPGFETAVLISLFSDARASSTDKLPGTYQFRNGYWGSELLGFNFGSLLWLLNRAKIDNTTLRLCEQFCIDALIWMKRDGIASKIEATATRGTRKDEIDFYVRIVRREADNVFFRFYLNWEYQIIGGRAA